MRFGNLAFSMSLDAVPEAEATPLSPVRLRFFASGSTESPGTGGG